MRRPFYCGFILEKTSLNPCAVFLVVMWDKATKHTHTPTPPASQACVADLIAWWPRREANGMLISVGTWVVKSFDTPSTPTCGRVAGVDSCDYTFEDGEGELASPARRWLKLKVNFFDGNSISGLASIPLFFLYA